jgi:hypothetical protein
MRIKISFGAYPEDYVNSFDILGFEWTKGEWFEIHLLGFIIYFDLLA